MIAFAVFVHTAWLALIFEQLEENISIVEQ